MGSYAEWRVTVESLDTVQRFADLWNLGRSYNFRLWRWHPRLRNVA